MHSLKQNEASVKEVQHKMFKIIHSLHFNVFSVYVNFLTVH